MLHIYVVTVPKNNLGAISKIYDYAVSKSISTQHEVLEAQKTVVYVNTAEPYTFIIRK